MAASTHTKFVPFLQHRSAQLTWTWQHSYRTELTRISHKTIAHPETTIYRTEAPLFPPGNNDHNAPRTSRILQGRMSCLYWCCAQSKRHYLRCAYPQKTPSAFCRSGPVHARFRHQNTVGYAPRNRLQPHGIAAITQGQRTSAHIIVPFLYSRSKS